MRQKMAKNPYADYFVTSGASRCKQALCQIRFLLLKYEVTIQLSWILLIH